MPTLEDVLSAPTSLLPVTPARPEDVVEDAVDVVASPTVVEDAADVAVRAEAVVVSPTVVEDAAVVVVPVVDPVVDPPTVVGSVTSRVARSLSTKRSVCLLNAHGAR